jgi:transcriptional regulator with XRE-family HTH domain
MLKTLTEKNLAQAAKRFRKLSGKTRAEVARDMGVRQVSVFQAEEKPQEALAKLRCRMIEAYSPYKVVGPVYLLQKK